MYVLAIVQLSAVQQHVSMYLGRQQPNIHNLPTPVPVLLAHYMLTHPDPYTHLLCLFLCLLRPSAVSTLSLSSPLPSCPLY